MKSSVPPEDSVEAPNADDSMTMQVLRDGDVATVVVGGEVDLLTVARFDGALATELAWKPSVLVVDLENVEFLGSMGLSALALAERAAGEKGIGLRVVARSRAILRPMEITGMLDQLAVYPTREQAVAGTSRRVAARPPG